MKRRSFLGLLGLAPVAATDKFTPPARAISGALLQSTPAVQGVSSTLKDFVDPLELLKYQMRKGWFQEDVAEGAVGSWASRGFPALSATNANTAQQPTKLANNGGVQFAAGTLQALNFATDAEAPWSHRNWIVVARTDQLLTSGFEARIVGINGVSGSNTNRHPYVYFKSGQLVNSCTDGVFKTVQGPYREGYANWNFTIGYRRGDQLCASVNGVEQPRVQFKGMRTPNTSPGCFIGTTAVNMTANVAVDCIIFFDGELTDKMVRMLEGWVAWSRAKDPTILPANHPFRNAAPTSADFGPADMPALYQFDQAAWDQWKAAKDVIRYTHRGQATYAGQETGYKRVFFTDWDRADQFPQSDLTGDPNSPWFAPGWLSTLGGANPGASIVQGGSGLPWPEAYVHNMAADAGGPGRPGTIAVQWIYTNGSWKNGAIYGVNNNGIGRYWGPGIYKTRFRFDNIPSPRPGLFPGPMSWSYGWEHLFWRSRNRIEQDNFELTGVNAGYIETNLHVHPGRFSSPGGQPGVALDANEELAGYVVGPTTGWPLTLNVYDGNWHDLVTKVEPVGGLTICWIDGIEFVRAPTDPAYGAQRYFIASHLMDRPHGERDLLTTEVVPMYLDSFEVMYHDDVLNAVPAAFSARPTIGYAGGAYTVTPNTVGSHLEYRWYVNGVPIVLATGPTFTMAQTTGVRVQVKNKSLANQPEAWTA